MGFLDLVEHFLQVEQVLLEHVANHNCVVRVHKMWLVSEACLESNEPTSVEIESE
jgi:hypothetical protein